MFSENQSMIISINNRFTFMDKKFIRYEGGGGAGGYHLYRPENLDAIKSNVIKSNRKKNHKNSEIYDKLNFMNQITLNKGQESSSSSSF
ncbi:hypothetical protein DERF_005437 [Dermatophagoides farinae]|uniref:Uncharacterized protein n=1 Tax=Dermatophagoides farinae TaxID=6954 RepID=A0A922I5M9_DERFA|nr:hypothetical protein DERF_005437 [Dermatophagoides farinae]